MKTSIVLILFSMTLAAGCSKKEDPNQNKYPEVFKENAVELLLHTKTLADGKVVFQLEKNIFLAHKQTQHLVISSDTLPSLGTDFVNVAEEDDEDARYSKVNKQYDVLFKVDSLKY
jgi:hypothetical protein